MYTAQEVLQYFNDNIGLQNHSKRVYVDPRNYVIALLHFKFEYTDSELRDIFNMHRTSIIHCRCQPYYHLQTKNDIFLENTEKLRELFPYEFPKPTNKKHVTRQTQRVILSLDINVYKKLKIKADRDGVYITTVVKEMLDKVMKVWEE